MISGSTTSKRTARRAPWLSWWQGHLALGLCLVYFIVLAPLVPGFASRENLQTIVAYLLPVLVAAVGSTIVLVPRGIDLSVTSIIAVCSVLGGRIMSIDGGWLGERPLIAACVGPIVMVLAGGILGGFNGLAVAVCRIPAFMATLTSMMFLSGLAIWSTQSQKIGGLPTGFIFLGNNLAAAFAIAIVAAAGAHLLLERTILGRWLRATGYNPSTATVSGVPVRIVTFLSFVAGGLCAGLASVLFTAALETANPEMARDNLLDIIGAVVIGGTSLHGGRGRISGTVFGVLFLALVDNSLNLVGLSFYAITMIKGAIILGAALIDTLQSSARRS